MIIYRLLTTARSFQSSRWQMCTVDSPVGKWVFPFSHRVHPRLGHLLHYTVRPWPFPETHPTGSLYLPAAWKGRPVFVGRFVYWEGMNHYNPDHFFVRPYAVHDAEDYAVFRREVRPEYQDVPGSPHILPLIHPKTGNRK